jgi:hypothetical protein
MTTAYAFNPMEVFNDLGYRPHAGQVPVLRSDARFRVVSAGRRFGKSNVGGNELIVHALRAKSCAEWYKEQGKRIEHWVVGPEYTDSEKEFRVLWNGLRKLEVPFDKPGSYNNPEGGFMHLSLWDGAFQVHAKSAKHPDTLVGEGLHGVILAEAAKLKEIVWVKYIRPMLADFDGTALFTSTPEGKNWFYEAWNNGQSSGYSEWWSKRVPSWMNPHVYKTPTKGPQVRDLLEQMREPRFRMTAEQAVPLLGYQIDSEVISLLDTLTPEAFLQEIGADFTEFVGRVFKEFDEEWHVGDLEYNPGYQHFAAVDYGFTNPNVWLFIQVDPWGNLEILDEIYERGLTADEFANMIKDRGLDKVRRFYPDPASPGDTAQLERILRVPSAGGTGGELTDRIDAIRAVLKVRPVVAHLPLGHDERLPRLRVDRNRCPNVIREFSAYRYPDRKDTILGDEAHENPMKKDDHTPEAFGRFLAGWEGTPAHMGGSNNARAKLAGSPKKRRM